MQLEGRHHAARVAEVDRGGVLRVAVRQIGRQCRQPLAGEARVELGRSAGSWPPGASW